MAQEISWSVLINMFFICTCFLIWIRCRIYSICWIVQQGMLFRDCPIYTLGFCNGCIPNDSCILLREAAKLNMSSWGSMNLHLVYMAYFRNAQHISGIHSTVSKRILGTSCLLEEAWVFGTFQTEEVEKIY